MTVPTPPPATPPPPPPGHRYTPGDPGVRADAGATAGATAADATAAGATADPGGASVGELIGNVTRDLSTLVRQELALAQAELRQEATKTGKAAGTLGAAGMAAFFVVLFLSLALWAGLANIMDAGWAGLLVAVLWAVVAAVLYVAGRARLREVRPRPDRTVDTLSSVPDALRGHRGGTP